MCYKILLTSCIIMLVQIFLVRADGWNMEFLGKTAGPVYNVDVVGDYAYVCAGDLLVILDVSDRSSPNAVARIDVPSIIPGSGTKCAEVHVVENHAYVAAGESLRVIDVSDPYSPEEAGFCDTRGLALGVHVVGEYAYVAVGSGIRVVDISDPTSPDEVGFYDMPGLACGIYVSESYAYVVNMYTGLRVIDISDPYNPNEVGSYEANKVFGVHVTADYAYIIDWDDIVSKPLSYLRILDVSDPTMPNEVGFYELPGNEIGFWFYESPGLYVSGSYVYVADDQEGLRVIDVADAEHPSEVGFCDTPGFAYRIHVSEDCAYVADDKGGLRLIDISDPHNPNEVGFYDTPDSARGVHKVGDYAYVADWFEGLHVVDVSDPYNPSEIGNCYGLEEACAVYVSGGYAYITGFWEGVLYVVDVSDPYNPNKVGSCNAPFHAQGVYVVGNYAYVADGGSIGLYVIDVSDPHDPRKVGFCGDVGNGCGVYVVGNYAYLAAGYDGLWVIDISDPSSPSGVGSCDTNDSANEVCVAGGFAYVACTNAGLRIIDISDPVNPSELGFYDTSDYEYTLGVCALGTCVYVADSKDGIHVIDTSNHMDPDAAGFYNTPGEAQDVYGVGNYAYVADLYGGLCILRYTGPDIIPPATVTDLSAVAGTTLNTIDLEWTAPGDDWDTGLANEYIIRYNTVPITESNWDDSYGVDGEPKPGPAGYKETMTVTMPHPNAIYYFAIKTQDEIPNTFGISNSPYVRSNAIYLHAGWNLISLPVQPLDTSIGSVLSPIQEGCESVCTYESNIGWLRYLPDLPQFSDLQDLESGVGYWIYASQEGTITISELEQAQTSIPLYGGWNLVGYCAQTSEPIEDCLSSIENNCNSVWEYDIVHKWRWYYTDIPGESTLKFMRPGMGYLIDAKTNCTWDIEQR